LKSVRHPILQLHSFRANLYLGITIANSSTHINLTRNGEDIFDEPFEPAFTYPIFGEDEKIIGYREPQIDLRFRSHDLKPTLKITNKGKITPPTPEIAEQMDLEAQLKEFLPECAHSSVFMERSLKANWTNSYL
jgi:Histone acetyl transferase HAT1 N-terminus